MQVLHDNKTLLDIDNNHIFNTKSYLHFSTTLQQNKW